MLLLLILLSSLLIGLKKVVVPVNCRTPTAESQRLTFKEKIDWVKFIIVLTIVPIGLQLWQFNETSAVTVNRAVNEEISRAGGHRPRSGRSGGDSTV